MLEAQLQVKVLQYLNALDECFIVKIIACNVNGCPDILICYRGRFLAVELKRPDGKGTTKPLQKLRIRQIKAAGGHAISTHKLERVKKLIKEVDDEIARLETA